MNERADSLLSVAARAVEGILRLKLNSALATHFWLCVAVMLGFVPVAVWMFAQDAQWAGALSLLLPAGSIVNFMREHHYMVRNHLRCFDPRSTSTVWRGCR